MPKIDIKQLLSTILLYFYTKIILLKIHHFGGNRIFIFDIDNTIADTWYSFNEKAYKSNNERLLSLPIYLKMQRLIVALYKSSNNKIFFISSRCFYSYKTTYRWLSSNGFPLHFSDLMIVRKPSDKLKIITGILSTEYSFYFIDDYSYNHEKGKVKFYSSAIDEANYLTCKHPNFKYFNFYDIKNFNNR